jgi:hypothetical protein
MMACDETPERTILEQRNRHCCGDAYILKILDVQRRHTAQHRFTEIERLAQRGLAGRDCGWNVIDVGDEAQPIALEDITRLPRNVAGRIVKTEKRLHLRSSRFREDFAVPVVVEAVNHDAIEARELRDLGGSRGAKLLHGRNRCKRPNRAAHDAVEIMRR